MKLKQKRWIVMTGLGLVMSGCADRPAVGDGEQTEGTSSSGAPDPTTPVPTMSGPSTMTMSGGGSTGTPDTSESGDPTVADGTTTGEIGICCEAHSSPGCNQSEVADCVCSIEAACCAFEWSEACVELALGRQCMASCDDPPGTTGDTGSTTDVPGACAGIEMFEMLPSEATHTGAWELGMSMIGEGEISLIANPGAGVDGSVLFEPDVPCADTWYIWVRYYEQGQEDSYFVTVDGEPMPEAVFEGDCTGGGQGYDWAALNWRDPDAGPCEYLEDPWAPDWGPGLHQIEFSYRESQALGRILLTNDQDFVPM